MESTKKTTKPTPKAKKTPAEKKPRVVVKAPVLEPMPELNASFSQKECCRSEHKGHKKAIHLLIVALLLANLVVGLIVICKLVTLHDWMVMGAGGAENLKTLEAIYQTPEYQEYFRGEITSLQTKIQTLNPAQ